MNLNNFGKVFTSKSVGTGPSSYKKRIYWAAFSQRLRNTALGDLTMSKLSHTARLIDCQRPILVVSKKNVIYSFTFRLGLNVCLCQAFALSLYVTLWILHVSHVFQGSAQQTVLPFVGCLQGFWLKDLWSNPFLPFTKGYLNGRYNEIYDRWLRTAGNWVLAIVLLD
jgi:hypothetical protein